MEGLDFSMQDATNLPYEDERFDAVMIANALHVMPEPEKALSEIRRVLKIELFGFKAYIKPTNEVFAQFIGQHGFDVMEYDKIGGKIAPLCCMIASKRE